MMDQGFFRCFSRDDMLLYNLQEETVDDSDGSRKLQEERGD
jgi:hypothetical protein